MSLETMYLTPEERKREAMAGAAEAALRWPGGPTTEKDGNDGDPKRSRAR